MRRKKREEEEEEKEEEEEGGKGEEEEEGGGGRRRRGRRKKKKREEEEEEEEGGGGIIRIRRGKREEKEEEETAPSISPRPFPSTSFPARYSLTILFQFLETIDPSLLFSGHRGSFRGVKRPGRDTTDLHIAPSLRRLDVYLCSTCLPSWRGQTTLSYLCR
jgi:hypothetical protein